MDQTNPFDLLQANGPSYLSGPVYLGAALDQTGNLSFFSSLSTKSTTFQSGNATAELTYTLPTAGPAADLYALTSTTLGVMSWSGVITSTGDQAISGIKTFSTSINVGGPLGSDYATATIFAIVNDGTSSEVFRMTSYGDTVAGGNNMHFVRTGGSQASPTHVLSGKTFVSMGFRGYDGSSYSDSAAAFQVSASEDWSPTAHGTQMQWDVTPAGSTTRSAYLSLGGNGFNVLLGNLTVWATSNQLALGGLSSSNQVILTAPTPATASRTITFPDLSGNYSVVGTIGTQTITGQKTLSAAAGNPIHGTNTNDSAATGYIGEILEGKQTSATNFTTSGQYADLASVSLTAGDWIVDVFIDMNTNAAVMTDTRFGISSTSGNSDTGLTNGDTAGHFGTALGGFTSASVTGVHIQLTGTTTYYLKYLAAYTGGPPQATGRITGVRIR